jgi:hypothetical protein
VLGVTPHGNRCGYAINFMLSRGLTPLIVGGEIGVLPKEQELEIRLQTAQRLGHNRVGITTAYSGAFTQAGKSRADRANQQQYAQDQIEPKHNDDNEDDDVYNVKK